jgi:hypothetical protein
MRRTAGMHDSASAPCKFIVAALATSALLAACGDPSSNGAGGSSEGSGGSRGATGQAGPAPSWPTIQAVPVTAPVVCDGGLRPRAYILGADHTLLDFDPETLAMHALGTLTCAPAQATDAEPIRITVSQAGFAYVLFQDANIYRVNLDTLACTRTPYVQGQLGFDDAQQLIDDDGRQWMAVTPSDDRLTLVGNPTTPTLAVSDLVGFQLQRIGAIEPLFYADPDFLSDVKMDAFGRIVALTYQGGLAQIDPLTGTVVAEDDTGFFAANGLGEGACWPMLLPYDGALYILGGCDNGMLRYDLATKTLEPVGQLVEDVWAVSAMACVHAPTDADAGADAAGSDASAPASDGGS